MMKAETIETDVLVIGGGAAGCGAALRARELGARVTMAVKGKMGRSGATPLASCLGLPAGFPGSYASLVALKKLYAKLSDVVPLPIPPRYADALRQSLGYHYWLVDQDYFLDAALWVDKQFYPNLEASGIYLLRDDEGKPDIPPGKNSYYVIHTHGMTGYQFGESRRKEVLSRDIQVLEEASAFALLHGAGGEVAGAMVLDYRSGRLYAIAARRTILATGHTNWLSSRATGTREMAANGLAMAVRAGAELQNLEIQWFHASDMAYPDCWMRLHNYPNPLNGSRHQVAMTNAAAEQYMKAEDYDTVMPYTIQMKKLYEQVAAGKAGWEGGNYTDFRLVEPEMLEKYQYHFEFYEKLGKDMSKDRFESLMTWHMSAGGVRADTATMQTGVPGLLIAGAVGGHMLGGLPFASYDGAVAGAEAARGAQSTARPALDRAQVAGEEAKVKALFVGPEHERNVPGIAPIKVKKRIRRIVWERMMFEKTGAGLREALAELAAVREEMVPNLRLRSTSARYNTEIVDALDVEDMLDVCEMAAHASLAREESRGPHFRKDFPMTDNLTWLKQVVVRREGGEVKSRLVPVKQKYLRPKREKIDYLADPYT